MERRAVYPNRKISETLLAYAEPLLEVEGLFSEAPEARARRVLKVAFAAWNAVVFADVLNEHRYLDEIRRLTAGTPETAQIMEHLIARKRAHFADDERMIGTWEVTRTEDGINLRAEALDPYSVPTERGSATVFP